jgi:hypothetical protein
MNRDTKCSQVGLKKMTKQLKLDEEKEAKEVEAEDEKE